MKSINILKAFTVKTNTVAGTAGIPVVFEGTPAPKVALWARATLEDFFGESRSIGHPTISQTSGLGVWTVDIFLKDKGEGDKLLVDACEILEEGLQFLCITISPSGTRIFGEMAASKTLPKTEGFLRMQIRIPFRATGVTEVNGSEVIDLG